MGYGWNTRSAEDVQRDSRQYYDFAKIKQRYEEIEPLRGKRAKFDIRPHGQRDRAWERIVKVNENEYYLTNDAYAWFENESQNPKPARVHQRLMSFKHHDGIEYFTLHTTRSTWRRNDEEKNLLAPREMGVPSRFWFIRYNMPNGLGFLSINSRKYVDCNGKYYTAERGDITFTRKDGDTVWNPLVVHREVIHHLDRAKTKEVKEKAKDFLNYATAIAGLVETRWRSEYALMRDSTTPWEDRVKINEDGSFPDWWLGAVEYYKHRGTRFWRDGYSEKLMRKAIIQDIYQASKPLIAIEVPLGTPCKDRFANWFYN